MNTTQLLPQHEFKVIVPSFLDEYGLDPHEYRLYSHIVRRAGKDGCFESIPNMAKICLMNEKTVRKALRVLIAAKLIKIIQQRLGKATVYEITHTSEWVYSHQLNAIRQQCTTKKLNQDLIENSEGRRQEAETRCKTGTTNFDTPTENGGGSSTNSGRGVVPIQVGVVVPSQAGVLVPKQVDEVYPIKEIPIKELPLTNNDPLFQNDLNQKKGLEEENINQVQQNQPLPQKLTSLSNFSESCPQTDNPSIRSNIAPPPFDKSEQQNLTTHFDPFFNRRTFIPAKGTYKSSSTDPWMQSANMPNREFAQWLFDKRYKHLPGKMISDAFAEIRNNFERANDLWNEFINEKSSVETKQPQIDSLIGYFSNRSQLWHESTFCELLQRVSQLGVNDAITWFANRYDQQYPGATSKWLSWLQVHFPKMYAHLNQKAA